MSAEIQNIEQNEMLSTVEKTVDFVSNRYNYGEAHAAFETVIDLLYVMKNKTTTSQELKLCHDLLSLVKVFQQAEFERYLHKKFEE